MFTASQPDRGFCNFAPLDRLRPAHQSDRLLVLMLHVRVRLEDVVADPFDVLSADVEPFDQIV